MIVITSAHRQAGITGQENLACETFTTSAIYRGKGLFCSALYAINTLRMTTLRKIIRAQRRKGAKKAAPNVVVNGKRTRDGWI
jgi:hypothetical protein